jgi:DNA replication licensing factor MCM5
MFLFTGKIMTLAHIFREQLQKNAREGKYFLRVSMEHLLNFDENLAELLRSQPTQVLQSLEQAIGTVYKNHYADESFGFEDTPSFQLQVSSNENPRMLRDLQSNLMG